MTFLEVIGAFYLILTVLFIATVYKIWRESEKGQNEF